MRISVPDQRWAQTLGDLDAEVVVWDGTSEQPTGRLDLVLWPYLTDIGALSAIDVTRVGLIQGQSLGYDGVAQALPPGAVYANAVDVHESSTAELAMALLLSATRGVDGFVTAQSERRWAKHWTPGLIDRRVLLLGVGGIGREILARLSGFGATTVLVGSRARDEEWGHVHGVDELEDLLPDVDAVVIAVPLTSSTAGLVDAEFLARLPDGALVVNVARGQIVATEAVVAEHGRIAFAADVVDPEPLPPTHPLWTTPGVLITPHVGGMSSSMRSRVEKVVRRQVARLLAGEEPGDVVLRT